MWVAIVREKTRSSYAGFDPPSGTARKYMSGQNHETMLVKGVCPLQVDEGNQPSHDPRLRNSNRPLVSAISETVTVEMRALRVLV